MTLCLELLSKDDVISSELVHSEEEEEGLDRRTTEILLECVRRAARGMLYADDAGFRLEIARTKP